YLESMSEAEMLAVYGFMKKYPNMNESIRRFTSAEVYDVKQKGDSIQIFARLYQVEGIYGASDDERNYIVYEQGAFPVVFSVFDETFPAVRMTFTQTDGPNYELTELLQAEPDPDFIQDVRTMCEGDEVLAERLIEANGSYDVLDKKMEQTVKRFYRQFVLWEPPTP
ncbi:MAG: hypothetical protein ACRC5C_02115, partial [Bacilli bacterium]